MADIPSTWPDNYVDLQQQKTTSHYEQKVWPEYGKLSFETSGVVFYMNKNLITILDSPEVKQNPKIKIEELKSEISWELIWEKKEQFIQQLNKSKNQDIQNSIESWTIKNFEIPWSEKVAISLNWNNIDYIYNLDWTEYFDFQWRRNDYMRYGIFKTTLQKKWFEEKEEWWKYFLYRNNKQISNFSEEYLTWYLETADFTKEIGQTLSDIADQMEKEGR